MMILAALVSGAFALMAPAASASGYPPPPPVTTPPVVHTLPPPPAVPGQPALTNLSPQDLAKLSPQELTKLSPKLAKLSPEELAKLSPEQVAQATQLGRTGADVARWVQIALALIALGAVLLVVNRRRSRVST